MKDILSSLHATSGRSNTFLQTRGGKKVFSDRWPGVNIYARYQGD